MFAVWVHNSSSTSWSASSAMLTPSAIRRRSSRALAGDMGRVWRRELSMGRRSLSLRRVSQVRERRRSKRRCRASLLLLSVIFFLARTSSLEPKYGHAYVMQRRAGVVLPLSPRASTTELHKPWRNLARRANVAEQCAERSGEASPERSGNKNRRGTCRRGFGLTWPCRKRLYYASRTARHNYRHLRPCQGDKRRGNTWTKNPGPSFCTRDSAYTCC